MRRVTVVGNSGTGKTTFAARAARALNVPHIELDALHWEAGWRPAPLDVFRTRVEQTLSSDAWVADGNYSKVRDIVWRRAQALVWLDFPLPVVLWQLLCRSLRRITTRELLWGRNRESLRGLFFSRESLFLWALQSHRRHHQEYPRLLARPEYAHLQVIRLRSRKEAMEWLFTIIPNP